MFRELSLNDRDSRPRPDFLPFQVNVREHTLETANDSVQITFRWGDKDREIIRATSEAMAKSLSKLASIVGGKKKPKAVKREGGKPSAEEIARLKLQATEEASSIPTAPEGIMVRGATREQLDVTTVTNLDGWVTGTTILIDAVPAVRLTVVKDAPTVSEITLFPGNITKGSKLLKSAGLMVGYPAMAQAATLNATKVTYLWEHEAKANSGSSGAFVYAGEGPVFWPQEEHIGLRLKVFATPHDEDRRQSGRSAVSYLVGTVKAGATAGILSCRSRYLAVRGRGPQHKGAEQRMDKPSALPSSAAVGADFMPLFGADALHCTGIHEPASLSNKSGYLELARKNKVRSAVRLCKNPLLCVEGEEEAVTTGRERKEVRIVSFNILADCYAGTEKAVKHLFGYCDPAYLPLDYRLQLVGAELDAYDAEIVCLQEVDKKAFHAFLLPFMSARGYSGHLTLKDTAVNEGCATFTKQAEFEVAMRVDLRLGKSMKECGLFDESFRAMPQAEEVLVNKLGMIGQVTVLRHRSSESASTSASGSYRGPERYVVVGNTHEFYHPQAAYARLLQTFVITRCLGAVAQAVLADKLAGFTFPGATVTTTTIPSSDGEVEEEGEGPDVSVVFLGDLNSTLETAVVEYLETGRIDNHHPVWKTVEQFDWDRERGTGYEVEEEEEDEYREYPWPTLVNPLGAMQSASGYPQFTNFTAGFKDVLDYMFVPSYGPYAHLRPVRIAPMPTEARLEKDRAIPSATFPSDHVALAVDLAW
jgi:mRNA deadenylase 3'-5' endonuclease subunit Ccr4